MTKAKTIIEKLNHKREMPFKKVEVILLGLTPGRVQHEAINTSEKPRHGAFKGQMRVNLFRWFKELGLVQYFNLKDKDDMFLNDKFEKKIHFTSLLREPVYYPNGKNYSGRNPFLWKNDQLNKLILNTVRILEKNPKKCVIIPCGDIVAEALKMNLSEKKLKNVLLGFPHPSPLNSHANKIFNECKRRLKKQIEDILF